jgi:hypothetical protein
LLVVAVALLLLLPLVGGASPKRIKATKQAKVETVAETTQPSLVESEMFTSGASAAVDERVREHQVRAARS